MTGNRIEIAPSILSADFARLGEEIAEVKAGGASMIHVDVMDGHFVPNLTVGVPVVESLRKATDLLLDVHLMIEEPERYISAFAEAGADMVSVHQEATPHLERALAMIREAGCEAGAVINPATPVNALSEVLDQVDYVLVMSVNPGFGGQKFIPSSLRKIQQLKTWRSAQGLRYRIEVDGGVGLDNLSEIVKAGAEIIVAGSAIFHSGNPRETVAQMLRAATYTMA